MIKLSKYHKKLKLTGAVTGLCTFAILLMGQNGIIKKHIPVDTTKYIVKIDGNEIDQVTGKMMLKIWF